MLFDLTFPCNLTTFSGNKCLSGKVICDFFCPAYRSSPVMLRYCISGKALLQCSFLSTTYNIHAICQNPSIIVNLAGDRSLGRPSPTCTGGRPCVHPPSLQPPPPLLVFRRLDTVQEIEKLRGTVTHLHREASLVSLGGGSADGEAEEEDEPLWKPAWDGFRRGFTLTYFVRTGESSTGEVAASRV
jgi:hypothetical protein